MLDFHFTACSVATRVAGNGVFRTQEVARSLRAGDRLGASRLLCAALEPRKAGIDMERKYRVGERIIYVDKWSVPRDALVTIWWSGGQLVTAYVSENGEPGCNLAFISGDTSREDSCGRQIERMTSVVHKEYQKAHGLYWCWEEELDDNQRARLNADRTEAAA